MSIMQANSSVANRVVGPASSTDTAAVRFNGTGGKLVQDSTVLLPTVTNESIVNLNAQTARIQRQGVNLFTANSTTTNVDAPSGATINFRINATAVLNATSTGVTIGTTAPTHSLTLPSTATGISYYNTSDQTTNYERNRQFWSGNIFTIATENGGTGTARALRLNGAASVLSLGPGVGPASNAAASITRDSTGLNTLLHVSSTGLSAATGITQVGVLIDPTISQSSTAAYTALKINPTESTTGSGTKNLIELQLGGSARMRVASTGVLSQSSTGAQSGGLQLFNTADETTNFERFRVYATSNKFTLESASGGTGTLRDIAITNGSNTWTLSNTTTGFIFSRVNTAILGLVQVTSSGLTGSAGTQTALTIDPTISQSSTAGYTMLKVNPTESTVGSGSRLLADFQTGGSSKFSISSAGVITSASSLTDTSGTVIGTNITTTFNPASASTAQVRALTMSTTIPTTNSQSLSGLIYGAWLEARYTGTGSATDLLGSRSVIVLPGAAQNFGTITRAYGLEAIGLSEFASTPITVGTISTVKAINVPSAAKSSAGLTVTTNIGIDVAAQTIGGTNIGVRIAKGDTYSLQMSDTGGTAAGGITFGTDTTLYRSAADTLKTDDTMVALGFQPITRQTYTISNVTTDRAYDANSTTLDEVADTLGTLIADLRAIGLVL